MIVLAVDDEKAQLSEILSILGKNERVSKAVGFQDPLDALEWSRENKIDVAFLDIEMYHLNGFELAEKLKEVQQGITIVFLTGYANYALDAYKVHAIGYLLKPVDEEEVDKELAYIATYVPVEKMLEKNIKVQTFGNFEVYYKREPLKFKRSISKEIFAYLVDRRGAGVTMQELEMILFEYNISENSKKSLIRTAIAELRSLFRELGEGEVILKTRNSISLQNEKIDCDYYDFLEGKAVAMNSYIGEYMTNYSWGEITTAMLSNMKPISKE
ncbi:response regulator [Anaerosporobacter sp.]|uniref:response regulator n=1 Tax=Anaerosporobacter sp. TaxID=1872529 RepID=UPI00286ED3AA|nr:response regulator [Anaerosporobacter sp.]